MWLDLWFLPDFLYVIDLVWHFFPWLSPFFINSFVIQEEVLQSPDIPIMSTNTEMSPYTSSFNTHWSRSQDIPILSLHSSKEELSVSLNTQSQVPDESETIRHSHLRDPWIRNWSSVFVLNITHSQSSVPKVAHTTVTLQRTRSKFKCLLTSFIRK